MNYRKAAAAVLLAALCAVPALADDFKREGEGNRRAALDKMELKPFPAGAWSKLADWTNGAMPAPSDLNGKVVLICLWADWYAPSKRAMAQAVRLSEKFGKDGLVVIAPHNPQGWKDAKKPAAPKDGLFLLANDPQGEFRKALIADQDPNFYVIDRAGQLRFADLDKASVEPAVEMLIKEKADEAAAINSTMAAQAAKKDAEARRTSTINQDVSLTEIPEQSFTQPGAEAFKSVKWPKMPKGENEQSSSTPGQEPPAIGMTLPETGWLGGKPNTKGRAAVLYFWNPEVRETYTQMDIMNKMDLLKTQRSRDLVVAGVVCKIAVQSGEREKFESDPKKLLEKVTTFVTTRNLKQSILIDPASVLFNASLRGKGDSSAPLPWVAIVSSDGILRWSGWRGEPSFEAALEQVLRVDPGVQARRAAEDEYLKANNK